MTARDVRLAPSERYSAKAASTKGKRPGNEFRKEPIEPQDLAGKTGGHDAASVGEARKNGFDHRLWADLAFAAARGHRGVDQWRDRFHDINPHWLHL